MTNGVSLLKFLWPSSTVSADEHSSLQVPPTTMNGIESGRLLRLTALASDCSDLVSIANP
eukprot:6184749-Pleurochrysis_carterae.AAC.2